MANDLLAFTPEYWSMRTQIKLTERLVGKAICSFEERPTLKNGDKVHRPSYGDVFVDDYTKSTDITAIDTDSTDEFLTVNRSKAVRVNIDDVDAIQNKYDAANKYTDRMSYRLAEELDSAIMKEVDNADLSVDDGNIGGTSGSPITLTSSNAFKTMSTVKATLLGNDVETDRDWYAVLSPFAFSQMEQEIVSKGFKTADKALLNGYTGFEFSGFKIFQSNNIRTEIIGTATGQPSNTETWVIGALTITLVSSIGTTAGNVLIGADAEATLVNIAAFLNDPTTTSSTQVAITGSTLIAFKNYHMTATSTATTITLVYSGRKVHTEGLANFTLGDQIEQSMCGRMGNVDCVIQDEINVQIRQEPKQISSNYIGHTLSGIKTFAEGTARMLKLSLKVI